MRGRDGIIVVLRGEMALLVLVEPPPMKAGGHKEELALYGRTMERFLSMQFLYVQNVFYYHNYIVRTCQGIK
jgi:hypothetical protein